MTKIELIYNGETFQPTQSIDLPVCTHITAEWDEQKPPPASAWEVLRRLAGTVEMLLDWSSNHDHYLYNSKEGMLMRTR